MKNPFPLFVLALAAPVLFSATISRAEDQSITLSKVHLCCNSCVEGAEDAVSDIKDVHADADKDTKSITIKAPDKMSLQKAVDALAQAGFFGISSDPSIKVPAATVASGTTTSLKLSGIHLCCNKCVKSLNAAVATVKGVVGTNAVKDAKEVEIKGNFNPADVVAALNRAGFAAQPQP